MPTDPQRDLTDPRLNGGRDPENAPKPHGHFAVNMTIVIVFTLTGSVFSLLLLAR